MGNGSGDMRQAKQLQSYSNFKFCKIERDRERDYVDIQHIPCFIQSSACSNREVDVKKKFNNVSINRTYISNPTTPQDPRVSK